MTEVIAHTHVYIYIHTHTYIHTYIYIHIHIYMHGGGLVAKSCPTLVTPWTVAIAIGFSKQEWALAYIY